MIAIIDYGIGGLGLYGLIRKDFQKLPIIYFSDSGEVPYGKQSKKDLRKRILKVIDFLQTRGASKIIVACHSASSVVRDSDKGMIAIRKATLHSVNKRKPKRIGIIGGGRTIRSGYYKRELQKKGIKSIQRVAQPLSIYVERGEIDTPLVHKTVASILKPLRSCDAVLLACTHYPVLNDVIRKYTTATLIDPAQELYDSIKPILKKEYQGSSEFITTGNVKVMIKAARDAFHVDIPGVSKVTL